MPTSHAFCRNFSRLLRLEGDIVEGITLDMVKHEFTENRKRVQATCNAVSRILRLQELEDYVESAQSAAKTMKRRAIASIEMDLK